MRLSGSNQQTQRGTSATEESLVTDMIRSQLGAELRRLRKQLETRRGPRRHTGARSVVDVAAGIVNRSRARFYLIEKGEANLTADETRALALFYDANAATVDRLAALAEAANAPRRKNAWWEGIGDPPAWFAIYLSAEPRATHIDVWCPSILPGLLQTQNYATAAVPQASAEEIAEIVDIRMHRQHILARPDPPRIRVLLSESALRQEVGGLAVWQEQLRHLYQLTLLPFLSVLVVTHRAPTHPALSGGPIVVLRGDEPSTDLVYLESHQTAAYLPEPEAVAQHLALLDQIERAALDEDRSRWLIAAIAGFATSPDAGQ